MQAAAMYLDNFNITKHESAFESTVVELLSCEKGKYKALRGCDYDRGDQGKPGGEYHHSSDDCSGHYDSNARGREGKTFKKRDMSGVICGYCDKTGHYVDKCKDTLAAKRR